MPDPTTAPVTAEGLRAHLVAHLVAHRSGGLCPPAGPCAACDCWDPEHRQERAEADAILAALSKLVVPDDLPTRMAEAIRAGAHFCDGRCGCTPGDHDLTVTGVDGDARIVRVEGTAEGLAAAALSVRWEHAIALEAEVERLRADLDEAKKAVTRAEGSERYMEKHLRQQDNRVRGLRGEVERLRSERDHLRETLAETDLGSRALALEETVAAADADRDRLARELAEAQQQRDPALYSLKNQGEGVMAFQQAHAEQQRRALAAEAARDALQSAIAEAVKQIREWMTPGAPLFDPGHAAQVEALLKKTVGERTIAALDAPETPEPTGKWLEDLAEAGPAIHAAKDEPVTVTSGRQWDRHPFVQGRFKDVGVCMCDASSGHEIHAPETPARPTPERRRELLREMTQQAIDAGTYGEPAPEMRPAPETPGDAEEAT